ncbi:MAG: N-acetylmuramoyl-L-alanine amidase [Saprospiraceae bacterium]|nr:N-acetylmuramoyl-L-alanine amidase [Saprospiraceae bacterium]
MRPIVICFILFISTLVSAQKETSYLVTRAERGDGVLSLLRRFDLEAYSCNVEEFYKLNQMEKTDGLINGRDYLLPIRRFTYNGRSIRSTIGITDFDLAVQIQQYNRDAQAKGRREEAYEKDKDLWLPFHFLNCLSEISDTKVETTLDAEVSREDGYAIFGPACRKVEKKSSELEGQVIYIISGHGGPDPGAIGKRSGHTLCEDEYAYDVCLRLTRQLIQRGALVYMIVRDDSDGIRDEAFLPCDSDETVLGDQVIPLNQKERLYQRTATVNRYFEKHKKQGVKSQTTVEIHVDSNNQGLRRDVFFYHLKGSKGGKAIAEELHRTFKQKYGIHQSSRDYHGTVTTRDLYTLRETSPQAVYIELANIRNPEDQRRLVITDNREAVAKWLAEGLTTALLALQ